MFWRVPLGGRALAAALVLAWWTPVAATTDIAQVRDLLKRMSHAMRETDYQGVVTYEHGGALDTVELAHAVRDGVEHERLFHLDGPPREVIRRGHPVRCQPPGDRLLRGLPQAVALGDLQDHYHFYLRGEERVAGRWAQVLQAVPKDPYRYGYSLGIDRETGLLLKSLLVGPRQQVLERFQFVTLTLGPVPDAALQPQLPHALQADPGLSACAPVTADNRRWQATWLPPGFVAAGQRMTADKGQDVLMFTDGLSTFSVFIEPFAIDRPFAGHAQRGGTVAFISRLASTGGQHIVTVVGEVPVATAQRVAANIKPLP